MVFTNSRAISTQIRATRALKIAQDPTSEAITTITTHPGRDPEIPRSGMIPAVTGKNRTIKRQTTDPTRHRRRMTPITLGKQPGKENKWIIPDLKKRNKSLQSGGTLVFPGPRLQDPVRQGPVLLIPGARFRLLVCKGRKIQSCRG